MGFSEIFTDFYASIGFAEIYAEAPLEEEDEGADGNKGGDEEGEGGEEEGGEEGGDEGGEDEGGDDEEEEEEEEPEDPKPKLEEGESVPVCCCVSSSVAAIEALPPVLNCLQVPCRAARSCRFFPLHRAHPHSPIAHPQVSHTTHNLLNSIANTPPPQIAPNPPNAPQPSTTTKTAPSA